MTKRKVSCQSSSEQENKRIRVVASTSIHAEKLTADLRSIKGLEPLRKISNPISITNYHLIYGTFTDESKHLIAINENNLTVFLDQTEIGSLEAEFTIHENLRHLNDRLGSINKCAIKNHQIEVISICDPTSKIIVKNVLERKHTFYYQIIAGEQKPRKYKKDLIDFINKILAPACQSFLADAYGFKLTYLYRGTTSYHVPLRREEILISDLVKANPSLLERYKSTGEPHGTFVCDPKTNRWCVARNRAIENMLTEEIRKHIPSLNDDEIAYISRDSHGKLFRNKFEDHIIWPEIKDLLGTNKNVFPIGHQVVCHDIGRLRLTTPCDYVLAYANWTYSHELAELYREDLSQILEKIFPVENERNYYLTFQASLLHGYRTHRCLLVLTDKRVGSNGKSTSFKIDSNFFGPLFMSNTKFVCRGSIEQDRNSHDAGSEKMRGVRLVVADELKKNNRLNAGWLKFLTGDGTSVEGRKIHTSNVFKYEWQAGIKLAFNEGDCPQFDATDGAFMERMRVIPMRSKFVAGLEKDDPETLTFRMDHDLYQKLPLYNSALLDLLLKYRDESVLDKVPESMQQWKDELCGTQNPLFEWLEDHLEPTNEPGACVSMKQLYTHYLSDVGKCSISAKTFIQLAKVVLRLRNIHFVEKKQIRMGAKVKTVRNAIIDHKYID